MSLLSEDELAGLKALGDVAATKDQLLSAIEAGAYQADITRFERAIWQLFDRARAVRLLLAENNNLRAHIDALKAERDGLKEDRAVDLELLAQFMIQHSFATGHGESIAAMLGEFDWQIRELRATARTSALKEAAEAIKARPSCAVIFSFLDPFEAGEKVKQQDIAAILAIAEVK